MTPRNFVAITGTGWVTPRANGTALQVLRYFLDRSGTDQEGTRRRIDDLALEELSIPGAEWREDRATFLSAPCIDLALREARASLHEWPSHRVGMALGCAFAGQLGMIAFAEDVRSQSARFVSPLHFPETVGNYPAGALARTFRIRGPNQTVARGAASGLEAVIAGCRMIRDGEADVVLAGGVDTWIDPFVASLSKGDDDEWVEGACWFVMERTGARERLGLSVAPPLAIVESWRDTVDAAAAPAPHATAEGASRAEGSIGLAISGMRRPGAVCLDALAGHAHAASGAATVAGAIGILHGLGSALVARTSPSEGRRDTLNLPLPPGHDARERETLRFAQAVAVHRAGNGSVELLSRAE